jgi:proteasome lid subunit RPN8/RPN11
MTSKSAPEATARQRREIELGNRHMGIKWTDATPVLKLPPLPARDTAPALASGQVDTWIERAVDRQVLAHLRARPVEQGGLLVGRAFADPETGLLAHVRITGCAPADEAEGTAFSLRMGTRVWQAAQALLGPEDLIVGWYHSHPGLSAFFSDTDRQTQRAFFNNPYSIGWVIDPTDGDEAFFLGGDCLPLQRGPDRWEVGGSG